MVILAHIIVILVVLFILYSWIRLCMKDQIAFNLTMELLTLITGITFISSLVILVKYYAS